MPVWHAKTAPLAEQDQLRVLGIVEEQHPVRAQLFMQWQQMKWPLLVDAFNLLDVGVVPVTLLIDEAGIVRRVGANLAELEAFLTAQEYPAARAAHTERVVPEAIRAIWNSGPSRKTLSQLIAAATTNQDEGRSRFRLGVAQRMMFDSPKNQPDDFARAVSSWQTALASNPNQYIWRRRIQQYGPRLDKPYPFYDWVDTAQREIVARGEAPVTLNVPLSGAEMARPERDFIAVGHPPGDERVTQDTHRIVTVTPVVVSATAGGAQHTTRVHLVLRPNATTQWNDEAGPTVFVPSSGTRTQCGAVKVTDHNQHRVIEFETHTLEVQNEPPTCSGTVYYHVCTGEEQQCIYLRQEVDFTLLPQR